MFGITPAQRHGETHGARVVVAVVVVVVTAKRHNARDSDIPLIDFALHVVVHVVVTLVVDAVEVDVVAVVTVVVFITALVLVVVVNVVDASTAVATRNIPITRSVRTSS